MSWASRSLDELGSVSRGRSRHRPRDAAYLYGGPYPFVQTADVKAANLYLTEYEQTYSEAGLAQSRLWPEGTLCITIAANIADTAILGIQACFPDSVIGFIPEQDKADARFVKYMFDAVLKMQYRAYTQGAAQDNLSQAKLLALKFPVPDVMQQRRVADILSAYDNLIENNRRRMALLEEAARQLYREWFVRLRFPGHEHTPVISGVPAGWDRAHVSELVKRVPAGKLYSQRNALAEGAVPILDQGRTGVIGYHNTEPSVKASLEAPVIVFANHTCYQRVIHYPFSAIQNVLPFVPTKENARNIYWLHHATDGLVRLNAYKGHWPELMAKTADLPPARLCQSFGEIARNFHLMIHTLEVKNKKLANARDLLLPRLMDGEIAI